MGPLKEFRMPNLLINELFWPTTAGQVFQLELKFDGELNRMSPIDPWINEPWTKDCQIYPSSCYSDDKQS